MATVGLKSRRGTNKLSFEVLLLQKPEEAIATKLRHTRIYGRPVTCRFWRYLGSHTCNSLKICSHEMQALCCWLFWYSSGLARLQSKHCQNLRIQHAVFSTLLNFYVGECDAKPFIMDLGQYTYIYMYMCIAKNMLMDPCNSMPRAPDAIKTLSKRKYNPNIL